MKSRPTLSLIVVFLTLSQAWAQTPSDFPVRGSLESPLLVLDLGKQAMMVSDDANYVAMGEGSARNGAETVMPGTDEVSVLHPGFGHWSSDFRFNLSQKPQAQSYQFWARWRQGGEPDVCVQTFEIWAGADSAGLELRATFNLKPKGWEYAWIGGESWVNLKPDDRVIEVRNSGAGHDAKLFDAFILAPVLASLPTAGREDSPSVLLELGKAPRFAGLKKNSALQVLTGSARAGSGAESLLEENDEVQIFHKGFGAWDAEFDFELDPAIPPGKYRLFARYKSGGEISQVTQRFTVKAGVKPEQMSNRGELTAINNTPWEYQWLAAEGAITLLPGDRNLQIGNSGQADGAKVFDAFLLQRVTTAADWMSAEQAQLRNRFLTMVKPVSNAKRRLYLLDGDGKNASVLFSGLADSAAKPRYEQMSVSYLIGSEAESLAQRLNISRLPAALISDELYSLLGVLTEPKKTSDVLAFLDDPEKVGWMPTPVSDAVEKPIPLRNGRPEAWLVGGLQDGLAGLSMQSLDAETALRPNPGQSYLSQQMMGGEIRQWQQAKTRADGSVVVLEKAEHSYGWSRGSAYAQVYFHVDDAIQARLHLTQSGIRSGAWLDGRPLQMTDDMNPPGGFESSGARIQGWLKGWTTEGLVATAQAERQQAPQQAELALSPGWHSLLLKLVMQHDQGQRFFFNAVFTDEHGRAVDKIQTRLSDPSADLALNRVAGQLRPQMFVDAPANLPHPGDSIKLNVDLRWHGILEQADLSAPLPRFRAKLLLRLVDYDGKEIAIKEVEGLFPGQAKVDFDALEQPGYYAVYASLYGEDGRLIMHYPADGFAVVKGEAEQKRRLDKKKLWNNDYYALEDGDKSFSRGGYFDWLQRMGIFRSYGSYPGFDAKFQDQWRQAKDLGLQFFADSSGDSNWLNDKAEDGRNFIRSAAGFTRFFKATNEIDIRHESSWQALRDPAHWVERAKTEYQQAHASRSDAHYVGGSLVRPAEGDWFKRVLQLGLGSYQDAWDVHAYPQHSPRFGQPIGNGETEDERGVLAVYAALGKQNVLPFWLGEAGAKAMHGWTGRRWQAEQAAKMIAWVNSRSDYLGLAFCIAHEYDQAYGRIWDYSMGHKPGEAALYTAGALIDGLPYQVVFTGDKAVQAGRFGPTLMIWRDDERHTDWPLQLEPSKTWVVVDVVGRTRPLVVGKDGSAEVEIAASPVYILSSEEYQHLTRN